MNDLLVIVPSRGRPDNAHRLIEAFEDTGADCDLRFAVDEDDPTWDEYPSCTIYGPPSGGMTAALNRTAMDCLDWCGCIGFLGDDHVPRTNGWDKRVVDELRDLGSGWVYGDDLIHGQHLPTAYFVTADIVRTLGWMAPPWCRHLFVDDTIKTLGQAAGCIRFLPDVVIEHCHPIAGKAESDEGYVRVNSSEMWAHDEAAFNEWKANGMANDVAKVVALRSGR